MIQPKIFNETSVTFGPVRVGFTNLLKPKCFDGESPDSARYSLTAYIPKGEEATVKALRAAVDTAYRKGVSDKWHGKKPPLDGYPSITNGDSPTKNGDSRGEEAQGMWLITPKSARRPGLVDRNKAPIYDEEEVYPGMWCYLNVTAFPYDAKGNRGIGWALNNVMKFKDDDRFGGGISASQAFGDIDLGTDDDDL